KVSYVLFLILFLCVPVAALAYLMHGSIRRVHVTMLAGIATLAVVYTSPWDNYLVATRVWYYTPELILNIQIAYVPVEVYAFFVLQSCLTGLFALWLCQRFYPVDFAEKSGAVQEQPARKRKRTQRSR